MTAQPPPAGPAATPGRSDLPLLLGGIAAALAFTFGAVALVRAFAPSLAESPPALVEALFALVLYGGFVVIALVGGALSAIAPLRMGTLASGGIGCLVGLGALLVALAGSIVAGGLVAGGGANADALVWLPVGAAAVTIQVFGEEALFRGWLQPLAIRLFGAAFAIPAIAVVFALLHFAGAWLGPVAVLNLALGGLLFGLLAWHSGGLAAPLAAHLAWNALEMLMFGLVPNPGIGSYGALIDLDLKGSELAGGGAEGLNESLQMTAALLVATGGVYLWTRLGKPNRPTP